MNPFEQNWMIDILPSMIKPSQRITDISAFSKSGNPFDDFSHLIVERKQNVQKCDEINSERMNM